jgi:hypothetical protein
MQTIKRRLVLDHRGEVVEASGSNSPQNALTQRRLLHGLQSRDGAIGTSSVLTIGDCSVGERKR